MNFNDLLTTNYGSLDIDHLNGYLETAEKLGIDEQDIHFEIESLGYEHKQVMEDINIYYYATISSIFYKYLRLVEEWLESDYPEAYEKIKEWLENERDNFSPFINCLDSWYNNILDEIDIDNTEESFKEYLKALSKEQ